jgi:hypothetical protein
MRDLSASHVGKKHAVVADTVYSTKGVSELHRLHGPIAPLACPKPGATQQTGHAWSGHTVHPTCQRPANCQHKCLGTGHQTGCTLAKLLRLPACCTSLQQTAHPTRAGQRGPDYVALDSPCATALGCPSRGNSANRACLDRPHRSSNSANGPRIANTGAWARGTRLG